MNAKFLNVDLEVGSKVKLDVLAADMGDEVFVLYSGRLQGQNFLSVETTRQHKGPDATIHRLCAIVERLSPAGRRIWNSAKKRFDIGFEIPASAGFSRLGFGLQPDTVQRVGSLGASLAVTYYLDGGAEPDASPNRRPVRQRRGRTRRKGGGR